jgi:hypothetical protein
VDVRLAMVSLLVLMLAACSRRTPDPSPATAPDASPSASASQPDAEALEDLLRVTDAHVSVSSGKVEHLLDGNTATTWSGAWLTFTLPPGAAMEALLFTGGPGSVRITRNGFDYYRAGLNDGETRFALYAIGGTFRIEALPEGGKAPDLVIAELAVLGKPGAAAVARRAPRLSVGVEPAKLLENIDAFCASFEAGTCARSDAAAPGKGLVLVDLGDPSRPKNMWRAVLRDTGKGLHDTTVRVRREPAVRQAPNWGFSATILEHVWLDRIETKDGALVLHILRFTTGPRLDKPNPVVREVTHYEQIAYTCRGLVCDHAAVATAEVLAYPATTDGGIVTPKVTWVLVAPR